MIFFGGGEKFIVEKNLKKVLSVRDKFVWDFRMKVSSNYGFDSKSLAQKVSEQTAKFLLCSNENRWILHPHKIWSTLNL